jgi:VIT1/CCC1 family predicted Fe2+/Mn2+ transporter
MSPLVLVAATRSWPLTWSLVVAGLVLAVVGLVALRRGRRS